MDDLIFRSRHLVGVSTQKDIFYYLLQNEIENGCECFKDRDELECNVKKKKYSLKCFYGLKQALEKYVYFKRNKSTANNGL